MQNFPDMFHVRIFSKSGVRPLASDMGILGALPAGSVIRDNVYKMV